MTNKLAIFLALLIVAGLGADHRYAEWEYTTFLLRKLLDFVEWLAFWR